MNIVSLLLSNFSIPHIIVASSKNNKLKSQNSPEPKHKRIVDMGIRFNKIDGLSDSCLDVALAILEALSQNKQYSDLQNPGIIVDGTTYHMTPQFMTATHADLRGIVYFRLDDKTNNKHWRLYYKANRDTVALLDIYDKNGNSIDKNQMARLARQAKAFDQIH